MLSRPVYQALSIVCRQVVICREVAELPGEFFSFNQFDGVSAA
jgi:hypothetical protein